MYEVVKMSFKQGEGRGGSVAGEELRSGESQDGTMGTKPQHEQGGWVVMDWVLEGQGTEGSHVRGI